MVSIMVIVAVTQFSQGELFGWQKRMDVHGHSVAVVEALRGNNSVLARIGNLLAPSGTHVPARYVPKAVTDGAHLVMAEVFKKNLLPANIRLDWSGITNDAINDEQLVTSWVNGETTVTWADIDGSQAILTVRYPRPTLHMEDPERVALFIEEWLVENLNMPEPMPAKMKLYQTEYVDKEKVTLTGSVSLPDDVSNELLRSLPPHQKWCRNFRLVATPDKFSLVLAIHWITTGDSHAPPHPVKDGRRLSRFSVTPS